MIFENVLQIEYINNYDFKPEIIDKYYAHIILDSRLINPSLSTFRSKKCLIYRNSGDP
jgi:hypothetical protein